MVVGSKVRLRPVDARDLLHFLRWFNDPDVIEFLDLTLPLTEVAEREWLDSLRERDDILVFVIESTAENRAIGTIGLNTIDARHRHALLGLTVGEKEEWGKGFGTDAVRALLAFAFGAMRLNKVSLHVHADHAPAIRVYEKCGFRREGFLRSEKLRRGEYIDELVMAILRQEWEQPLVTELTPETVPLRP